MCLVILNCVTPSIKKCCPQCGGCICAAWVRHHLMLNIWWWCLFIFAQLDCKTQKRCMYDKFHSLQLYVITDISYSQSPCTLSNVVIYYHLVIWCDLCSDIQVIECKRYRYLNENILLSRSMIYRLTKLHCNIRTIFSERVNKFPWHIQPYHMQLVWSSVF